MNRYAIFVNGKLIKTFKTFKSAAKAFQISIDLLKAENKYDEVLVQVVGLGEGCILEN